MRSPALLVIACAIAIVSLMFAACESGDDELTLEAYFERVEALDDARAEKMDALDAELEELGLTDVAGGIDILSRQTDAREEFADGLAGLDRPGEIAGLHDTAVASLNRAADEYREYIEANRDAQSVLELIEGFGSVDFEAINTANEQCEELERYAERNGIEVDIACE